MKKEPWEKHKCVECGEKEAMYGSSRCSYKCEVKTRIGLFKKIEDLLSEASGLAWHKNGSILLGQDIDRAAARVHGMLNNLREQEKKL